VVASPSGHREPSLFLGGREVLAEHGRRDGLLPSAVCPPCGPHLGAIRNSPSAALKEWQTLWGRHSSVMMLSAFQAACGGERADASHAAMRIIHDPSQAEGTGLEPATPYGAPHFQSADELQARTADGSATSVPLGTTSARHVWQTTETRASPAVAVSVAGRRCPADSCCRGPAGSCSSQSSHQTWSCVRWCTGTLCPCRSPPSRVATLDPRVCHRLTAARDGGEDRMRGPQRVSSWARPGQDQSVCMLRLYASIQRGEGTGIAHHP
jgi:hypothetical protein